jgi:hypothetical protein
VFGRKIPVDSDLYEQLKKCSEAGGYSSAEEFAVHVLEKAVDRLRDGATEAREEAVPEGLSEPKPTEEVIHEKPPESAPGVAAVVESSESEQSSESPQ